MMGAQTNKQLVKISKFNPRKNLPAQSASKRGEANFVGAFERAYISGTNSGVYTKQLALSGYGIADMVCLKGVPFGKGQKNVEQAM
jgi:hypothetical protein